MMRTIISLFDHSGVWCKPYREAGYRVLQFDLKSGHDVRLIEHLAEDVHGILIAPPCTEFSTSGAQYWPEKDKDGRTLAALALVDAGLRAVAIYRPHFWVLENPVGRLRRWLGAPAFSFNPCDYGGWLPEDHQGVGLVPARDAYTKKTLLWGKFNPPAKKPVEPIVIRDAQRGRSYSPIHWFTGGKSERTKELRSTTPEGFSRAFFASNP